MKRRVTGLLMLLVLSSVLSGCTQTAADDQAVETVSINLKKDKPDKSASASSKKEAAQPAKQGTRDNTVKVLKPEATGVDVYSCDEASLDCSNASEGYVCVKYTGSAGKVRMLIKTPLGNTYNYLMDLDGEYDIYPLSEGDGTYEVGVYENITADKYANVFTQTVDVALTNEYGPFLYPNAYVNFDANTKAVQKGKELAEGADTDLDVVQSVYRYLADNVEYDYDKAKTVQSGYLPTVDETLATNKGICFDYSSLMGAMLRSQGIPTRLDIGYAGEEYHAWISVYVDDLGWVDDIISFDGKNWTLMDPTLASYAPDKTIKDRWENRSTHYQLKYQY